MTTANNVRTFSIKKIGSWQYLKSESKVSLPALQRGFVWDARRIENLWDSLLKGYPIGSFLMVSDKPQEAFQLLDGQQRATAISIGMYNPWIQTDAHFWRITGCPVLWLEINTETDDHHFKIVTPSQPWGYDKQSERLKATDRKRAYDAMIQPQISVGDHRKYYELPLKHSWPWMAKVPIPFSFFFEDDLDYSNIPAAKEAFLRKCHTRLQHVKGMSGDKSEERYKRAVDTFLGPKNVLSDMLFERIGTLLTNDVPAIVIPYDTIASTGAHATWGESQDTESEDKEALEIIFERINSGGVALIGEELVYSIFKSQLPCAEEIGKKCDYIKPARLMHYAIRLVMADSKKSGSVFPRRVKVREFKEWLLKDDNHDKLANLIKNIEQEDSPFQLAKQLLNGDKLGRNPWQLSFYQTCDITDKSPDAFFLLLYRLWRGDRFEDDRMQKKALGFITSLCWFVDKKSQRGPTRAFEAIWRQHRSAPQDKFWSATTLKSAVTYDAHDSTFGLLPPCPPNDLEKMLNKLLMDRRHWEDISDEKQKDNFFKSQRFHRWYQSYFERVSTSEDDELDEDPGNISSSAMVRFVDLLRDSNGMLAFACRRASVDWFDNYFRILLEDTDRPWDLDHIYPSELTRGKRAAGGNKERGLSLVKDWQATIANFRLWPLELNRSDSCKLPDDKLRYAHDKERLRSCAIESEKDLFAYSAIDPEDSQLWFDLGDDPKDKAQADAILKAITRRMLYIYRDWYDSLELSSLFTG